MKNSIFYRLRAYYRDIGDVLKGTASAGAVFPNASDKGSVREDIYKGFLEHHLPSSCNIIKGGFLFDHNGNESQQLDLIIVSSSSPQFNFLNKDNSGKAFASIDGCIAIASIKSCLDKKEIECALDNLSSIPDKQNITNKIHPLLYIPEYEDWPLKILYATSGISIESASEVVNSYYKKNPGISVNKRPNLIHVAGKYFGIRSNSLCRIVDKDKNIPPKDFYLFSEHYNEPDVFALAFTMIKIQEIAAGISQVLYSYEDILYKICGMDIDGPLLS